MPHSFQVFMELCSKDPNRLQVISRAIHRKILQKDTKNQDLGNYFACFKELKNETPRNKNMTYLSPTKMKLLKLLVKGYTQRCH